MYLCFIYKTVLCLIEEMIRILNLNW